MGQAASHSGCQGAVAVHQEMVLTTSSTELVTTQQEGSELQHGGSPGPMQANVLAALAEWRANP